MLSRITQTNKIYIAIVILAANFVLFVKYAWNEAQQESYSHRSVTQAVEMQRIERSSDKIREVHVKHVQVSPQNANDMAPPLLFYNRVPKTGSTTFANIAYELAQRNDFSMLHINVTYKNTKWLNILDQQRFVKNVSLWTEKHPALYHGHLQFLDFTRFGYPNPVYINIIRDPIERLVSYYYFLRHGDDYRPKLKRAKSKDTQTLDDCIQTSGYNCNLTRMMWMQVPFFCGQHAQCLIPGSWALEQAKSNLANHFLLVGLTEQLGEFVALLETMLPRYFSGAYELYTNSKLGHLRKTKDKIAPSKETVRIIKESLIYQLEHELYEFAKEQFNFLKQRALKIDENERAIIMKPLFKYEKIV